MLTLASHLLILAFRSADVRVIFKFHPLLPALMCYTLRMRPIVPSYSGYTSENVPHPFPLDAHHLALDAQPFAVLTSPILRSFPRFRGFSAYIRFSANNSFRQA